MRPSPYNSARVTAAAKEKGGGAGEMNAVVCYYTRSCVVEHNGNTQGERVGHRSRLITLVYPSPFGVKP